MGRGIWLGSIVDGVDEWDQASGEFPITGGVRGLGWVNGLGGAPNICGGACTILDTGATPWNKKHKPLGKTTSQCIKTLKTNIILENAFLSFVI